MDIHVNNGEITIRLGSASQMHNRLFINDALQGEFGLQQKGPEDLQQELFQARAARAACSIMSHVLNDLRHSHDVSDHMVPAQYREAAFATGLEEGLKGQYRVIGQDRSMRIPGTVVAPDHKWNGPSFNRGWSLGTAILAAIEISQGNQDPRQVWYQEAIKALD